MSILKRWRLGRPAHEMRVLMVCMGNICRSPMAEGVLRGKLSRAGLSQRVGVASAGTHSHAGSAPDPRAQKAAAGRGYDLSDIEKVITGALKADKLYDKITSAAAQVDKVA